MKRILATGTAVGTLTAVALTWPALATQPPDPGTPPRSDAVLLAPAATPKAPAAGPDEPRSAGADTYIVTTRSSVEPTDTVIDAAPSAAVTEVTGPAFTGAVAQLSRREARDLAGTPGVVAVEREQQFTATVEAGRTSARSRAAGTAASWGLDRSDQRDLPLNDTYRPIGTGKGVDVYVVDSGIKADHPEFAGRVGDGAYATGRSVEDCFGHGTHVSGIIGSSRYGMAPDVTLHPVRVLDCNGGGSTSVILRGLNWVAKSASSDAVVNLSLRGSYSPALNSAVHDLVKSGLVVVTAAGNDGNNACKYSPGSESAALTVGAVDSADREAGFSNYGKCLDLYAPGVAIRSTDFTGGSGSLESGTSMAAPHVSGAAAVLRGVQPGLTGAQIESQLLAQATRGAVKFPLGLSDSPNLLLYAEHARVPGAPDSIRVAPRDSRVKVRWKRASSNTESTSYTVAAKPGGKTCRTTNRTKCTVKGLTNGVRYRFTVRASNAAGRGPRSTASRTVTPTDMSEQRPDGRVTKNLRVDDSARLPARTDQGRTISWRSKTSDTCVIGTHRVRGVASGTCRLRAKARATDTVGAFKRVYVITVS